jgi:hypothetical protein
MALSPKSIGMRWVGARPMAFEPQANRAEPQPVPVGELGLGYANSVDGHSVAGRTTEVGGDELASPARWITA